MADEPDYSALPLEEQAVHKVWKVRLAAYEKLAKEFALCESGDAKLLQYKPIVDKFVSDSNAAAQVKGIEAAIAFVDSAGKNDVPAKAIATAIATKGVGASKPQAKEGSTELCLLVLEVSEDVESVQEALLAGFKGRVPKVVQGCVALMCKCVEAFGAKVMVAKPILKALPAVFGHANVQIRNEAKELAIEMHRWLGAAMEASLSGIKPVLLEELQSAWADQEAAKPTRYLRSKKPKAKAQKVGAATAAGAEGDAAAEGGEDSAADDEEDVVDAYDLADPVDGLSKIPKSFSSDIQEAKWSIRRDALQAALDALTTVKLADGDYGDLVQTCKRVVGSDTNVINVALAAQCIAAMAKGLRDRFSPLAPIVFETLLLKFKEKKLNVVKALHEALDAVFVCMPCDKPVEWIVGALTQKNPQEQAQTATFLDRTLRQMPEKAMSKASVTAMAKALVDCMAARDAGVRDAATQALGGLIVHAGEKIVGVHISSLDASKQDKIKQAATATVSDGSKPKSQAVKVSKRPPATKSSSSSAPKSEGSGEAAAKPPKSGPRKSAGLKPRGAARASTARSKPSKSSSSTSQSKKRSSASSSTSLATEAQEPSFPAMAPDQAESIAKEFIGAQITTQVTSSAWKEKLEGVEAIQALVEKSADTIDPQMAVALFGAFEAWTRKWKETNFQVMGGYMKAMGLVADNIAALPDRCVTIGLPPLVAKIGDIKLSSVAADTLTSLCKAQGVNYVCLHFYPLVSAQRSPKVHTEALKWLSATLNGFGMKMAPKPLVSFTRKMMQSTNPGVRTAAVDTLATLRVFVGPSLLSLVQDEKPALLTTIQEAFDKVKSDKPPAPTVFEKGSEASEGEGDGDGASEDGEEEDGAASKPSTKKKSKRAAKKEADTMDDLIPRVDICSKLSASTITELSDGGWKIRAAALEEVGTALSSCPRLTGDLGDLAEGLRGRLGDSNKNLIITALNHLAKIGNAMPESGCKHYISIFLPDILKHLADNKDAVRSASLAALTSWHETLGLGPFLDVNDGFTAALKGGKPHAQQGALTWLTSTAEEEDASDLSGFKSLIAPTFSCLGDRNADVRKAAQGFLPMLVKGAGADRVRKAASKLSGSAKDTVVQAVDAAAGAKKTKKVASTSSKSTASKPTGSSSSSSSAAASTAPSRSSSKATLSAKAASSSATSRSASGSSGKEAALLPDPNKAQRIKDEKSHKMLRWTFTAPREEFVQQLLDLLKAVTTKQLYTWLSSTNFKDHCKALDALSTACDEQPDDCVASLDLLLKWVTLRFFETNPSVQIKCMSYLKQLFDAVVAAEYSLTEYESLSFLPYFIQKLGDKMENIRKEARELIKLVIKMYPASKLFVVLVDGLKSKNARLRTECLVCVEFLISSQGMTVSEQIGAQKAMRVIGKQVGDRDNGVRSAALDVIVTTYNLIGENVRKLMGVLPDKSEGLITERLKRCGKAPSPGASTKEDAPATAKASSAPSNVHKPKASKSNTKSAPAVDQAFSLDLTAIGDTGEALSFEMPELAPTQLADETILAPSMASVDQPGAETRVAGSSTTMTKSRSMDGGAADAGDALDSVVMPNVETSHVEPAQLTLEDIVGRVGSSNVEEATSMLKLVEEMARTKDIGLMPHTEKLLTACTVQLRLVFTVYTSATEDTPAFMQAQALRLCKHVLSCVMYVYASPLFVQKVRANVQQEFVIELVTRLLDPRLETWSEGGNLTKALNMILLRVLENSDRNLSFRVLVRTLNDACSGSILASERFTELIMKCIWKLTKAMPAHMDGFNLDQLFADVHHFFLAHPPKSWKGKKDTPLRTMKTILHTAVKAKGVDVIRALSCVGDSPLDTIVGSYLVLMLKKEGHDAEKLPELLPVERKTLLQSPRKPVSARSLPKAPLTSVAKPAVAAKVTGGTPAANAAAEEEGTDGAPAPLRSNPGRARVPMQHLSSVAEFAAMEKAAFAIVADASGEMASVGIPSSSSSVALSTAQVPAGVVAELKTHIQQLSDPAETKSAVAQILRLKRKYPNLDVAEYTTDLSDYMKSYVARKINEDDGIDTQASMSAVSYIQQLKQLRGKVLGEVDFTPPTISTSDASPFKSEAESAPVPSTVASDSRHPLARKDNSHSGGDTAPSASLSDLKARLARLKKGQMS
eukprot:m.81407 g.81407  ORF g.81407 m.81407 type:complete len:2144 (-) comp12634_c2_seq1:1600-8031(-)